MLAAAPVLDWAIFGAIVLLLLAIDLGVFHRQAHRVSVKEAAAWSIVWIAVALAFNGWVWYDLGRQKALEFLTGYLVEKSLSVDNLFVFLVIFSYFRVPAEYQHRVLFWGILGAIITRGIFIFAGIWLVERFDWLLYVLGAFLIFTGFKVTFRREEEVHPERNPAVRFFRKVFPLVSGYRGQKFFVRENGKLYGTLLLLTLFVVEVTDVIFALDSVPAVLAVTTDPFVVFTSNIFAILGLRALFFLLADLASRFEYLKVGVGMILVFVGLKMIGTHWDIHVDVRISLAVIGSLLATSVIASIYATSRRNARTTTPPDSDA